MSAGKLPAPECSAAKSPTRGPEGGAGPAGSCSLGSRRSSKSTSSRVSATHCPLVATGSFPRPGITRNSPQSCRGTACASSAVSRFRFRGLKRAFVTERAALLPLVPVRGAVLPAETVSQPRGPRRACAGFQAPPAPFFDPEPGDPHLHPSWAGT